jgi:hypothetical protein
VIELRFGKWSFDPGLQIIHADVFFAINGDVLVDEPLCIDVGLPALLLSVLEDTEPDRKAPAAEWRKMPFFVCGCGDPDCRGYSFAVKHAACGRVRIAEAEETGAGQYREDRSYTVSRSEFTKAVLPLAKQFLDFTDKLDDYRPYLAETVGIVRKLADQAENHQSFDN